MRKRKATLGSTLFLTLAPGTVPWWLTGWRVGDWWPPVRRHARSRSSVRRLGTRQPMRISVVDVGSNTVRLVVADAMGGAPLPVHTAKWRLRLSDEVGPGGRIPETAVERLVDAVAQASATASKWGAAGPLAFATAVVRGAPNRQDVLRAVRTRTGVELCTLPGEVEAELTFLGARRWMGWQSGPLALLDIGGGSLEVAFGRGRLPDFAASLPLGAGRLTREFFDGQDPPPPEQVKALRRRVRHQLRDVAARIRWEGRAARSPPPVRSSSWGGCAEPRPAGRARSPNGCCAARTCARRSTGWPRCPPPNAPNSPASPRRVPSRAWQARWSGTPR